jgi:two-component system NtrC family response regulator
MASILIADDDPLIRMTLRSVFERHSHSVVEVADGDSLLVQLAGNRFDLCVMDASMPGAGLTERLAAAQATAQPPSVLVLSGYGRPLGMDEPPSAGFAAKPIGLGQLEDALRHVGFDLRMLEQS